jgi:hypothetical protein
MVAKEVTDKEDLVG